MRYKVFHKLDVLAYVESVHVGYNPGRARTETARRLIMHMQSDKIKRKFPQLKTSYELYGYDTPARAHFKMQDGMDYEFPIEQYTLDEVQAEIHKSQFKCSSLCDAMLAHMKVRSLERLVDED